MPYHGGNNLKTVLEICLAERDLEFYYRAQARAFHQFLQDEWEEEQAKYNRFADQHRGKVRTEMLTYTLALLDQGDHDLDYSEVQRGMQGTAIIMTKMMAEIDGILGI